MELLLAAHVSPIARAGQWRTLDRTIVILSARTEASCRGEAKNLSSICAQFQRGSSAKNTPQNDARVGGVSSTATPRCVGSAIEGEIIAKRVAYKTTQRRVAVLLRPATACLWFLHLAGLAPGLLRMLAPSWLLEFRRFGNGGCPRLRGT